MSLGTYAETAALDYLFEDNLWAGVSTADPGEDGSTAAEPVGNGYDLVAITAATWAAASSGSKATSADITFPEASGSWGTITYFLIWDSDTRDNLMAYGELTASKTVSNGQTLKFPAGDVTITLD